MSPWMASSILKSGLGKAKKAKEHVEEGVEKVRATWEGTPDQWKD